MSIEQYREEIVHSWARKIKDLCPSAYQVSYDEFASPKPVRHQEFKDTLLYIFDLYVQFYEKYKNTPMEEVLGFCFISHDRIKMLEEKNIKINQEYVDYFQKYYGLGRHNLTIMAFMSQETQLKIFSTDLRVVHEKMKLENASPKANSVLKSSSISHKI